MKVWKKALVHVAWSSLLTVLPGTALNASAQQVVTSTNQSPTQNQPMQQNGPVTIARNDSKTGELPDSPGAMLSKAPDLLATQSAAESRLTAQSSSGSSLSGSTSSGSSPAASPGAQAPSTPQKPVGTAAAEAPNATGVAASQPAGIAIAPAKQHRVRTIVLRTGAIIGAGVAVGTVVALTAATPSKPPGAH
jgi:hypothetical protein